MNSRSPEPVETPLIVSLVDTSKSTIKMIAELWYALWQETHH